MQARAISDTGWITGTGWYDADGLLGPIQPIQRVFLMQIPEPSTAVLLAGVAFLTLRRRR